MTEINGSEFERLINAYNKLLGTVPTGRQFSIKNKQTGDVLRLTIVSSKPKKELTEDIVMRIQDERQKFIELIMDAIDGGKKSATITYYGFVYTILQSLDYLIKGKNGKFRKLSLSSYCKCFGLRRPTFIETQKDKNKTGKKVYYTPFHKYRMLPLDKHKPNRNDREEVYFIQQLKPIYIEIKEKIKKF